MVTFFKLVAAGLWPRLWPSIARYLTSWGRRLIDAAEEAVKLMEETNLPGDTKRAHARAMIREAMVSIKPDLRTRDIDAAIQAALDYLDAQNNG